MLVRSVTEPVPTVRPSTSVSTKTNGKIETVSIDRSIIQETISIVINVLSESRNGSNATTKMANDETDKPDANEPDTPGAA